MAHGYTTVFGAYRAVPALFDVLMENVPATINPDNVINEILMITQDMEVVYTDPYFFKLAVDSWVRTSCGIWEHLYETTQYEYNPIYNYDRTEEYTDTKTVTGTNKETNSGNDRIEERGQNSVEESTSESATKNITIGVDIHSNENEYTAGFNSNSPSANTPRSQKDVNGDEDTTSDETDEITGSKTTEGTDSKTTINTSGLTRNGESTGNETFTHSARLYGNIGVTTTQQMIEQERTIAEFNIIEYIARSFKNKFCIMVY